jgi:hypothetical protein
MKEIGGYFGLEQLVSNEYHKGLITLNNGRNALLYLLKARGIKKIYLPHYLCDSVSDMCIRNGYKLEHYNIDAKFMPIFDRKLAGDEYLYIVNYYGQITNEKVLDLKRKHKQIILDNTQAFFQRALPGIDTIYSCRKYFGVPDGAYLSTDTRLNEDLKVDVSKDRMTHILGRFEGKASDYYEHFQKNDASFKIEPLKYMSKLTHNILGAVDYKKVRRIRNENYSYLESELGGKNKLQLTTPDGAFAYPFYIKNGIEIRKAMAQKKIYIPILWPNVIKDTQEYCIEYNYAANILPLPCDQRYGLDEMKYIVSNLNVD